MSPKAILLFCAQALLAQSAFSQCAAGLAAPWGLGGAAGWAGPGLGLGLGGAGLGLGAAGLGAYGAGCGCGGVASTGGGLAVASASPIAPVGVSVLSENAYEGALAAGGNLPFLGTVGIEGVLPTAGAGAVSYGCGNGGVGIAETGPTIATGITSPNVFPPAGPAAGIAGYGLGGIGYGLGGAAGYGLGGIAGPAGIAGYGLGGLGCGCGGLLI